jgi:hypothetical protein
MSGLKRHPWVERWDTAESSNYFAFPILDFGLTRGSQAAPSFIFQTLRFWLKEKPQLRPSESRAARAAERGDGVSGSFRKQETLRYPSVGLSTRREAVVVGFVC